MAAPGDESHATASADGDNTDPKPTQTLTKTAQKKLLKLEGLTARKAETKAAEKQRKAEKKEKRRRNWNQKFESLSPEEKAKLLESNKEATWERIKREKEEHRKKIERLNKAAEVGQKVLLDLDFEDHMTANEIQSLSQQIICCYGANSRSTNPTHLWLTGCTGEMEARLKKIPGFDKWLIEKETRPYIEALSDQKENLVYLTADSENVLEELDSKSIYIIGGLVDRNRFKGITLDKAKQQGIKSAKLPIGNYLKMSSSQVLTVNQVFEIMLNFIETRDWKSAFFKVIPQRKRDNAEGETLGDEKVATQDAADVVAVTKEDEREDLEGVIEEGSVSKKQCIRETKDGEHMASEDNNTTEDNSLVNDNGSKGLL
ncbi:tRNA (guanine(9)-N1)-methyltransferase-like [Carex rostrata]